MNTRAGGGYLAVHWHKLSCFCNLKFVGCWLHFKQKSNLFFLISANIWTFTIILSSNILKYQLNTCSQPLMTEHTKRNLNFYRGWPQEKGNLKKKQNTITTKKYQPTNKNKTKKNKRRRGWRRTFVPLSHFSLLWSCFQLRQRCPCSKQPGVYTSIHFQGYLDKMSLISVEAVKQK